MPIHADTMGQPVTEDGQEVRLETVNLGGDDAEVEPVSADAELSAEIKPPSDQWKRGGICGACRRQNYCQTRCSANRRYASLRIHEYLRQRLGIGRMMNQMSELSDVPVGEYAKEMES